MSNAVNQLVDDIIKDTTKTLNKVTWYAAKRIADDWEEKARHVMDAYYSTDTAGRYDPTGSLENTIERVLRRKNKNGMNVAGVKFNLSGMSHSGLSQFSEASIMDNFMYGQHGNEDYTSPKTGRQVTRNIAFTTPHARIVMDQYYKNYDSKIDQYVTEAFSLFGL